MEEIREEQETLQRRLRDQEDRHDAQRGTQQHIFQSTPLGVNSRPPKFPLLATKASSWAKRMSLFLQAQGLGYTIQHSTNPVPIISDGDRGSLVRRHSEQTVRDHERAWCFLLDATADAPFEDRLLGCKPSKKRGGSLSDGMCLPRTVRRSYFRINSRVRKWPRMKILSCFPPA